MAFEPFAILTLPDILCCCSCHFECCLELNVHDMMVKGGAVGKGKFPSQFPVIGISLVLHSTWWTETTRILLPR